MTRDESENTLYLASVISTEEKMLWQSFQDLIAHSTKLAASSLQGIFGLDLLSCDIQEGVSHFNPQDFATLLINHGRRLSFGGKVLIKYGQIFSVLHKRAPADWGKIEVIYHVEIINAEKTKLSSFLKKMMNAAEGSQNPVYLIHDLGVGPVWDLDREEFPANVRFYQSDRVS